MGGRAAAAPAATAAAAAAASEPFTCAGRASGLVDVSADGSAICGIENGGGCDCDCDGSWPSEFISSALMRCVHCARRASIRAERGEKNVRARKKTSDFEKHVENSVWECSSEKHANRRAIARFKNKAQQASYRSTNQSIHLLVLRHQSWLQRSMVACQLLQADCRGLL